jgi:hypothetical protein
VLGWPDDGAGERWGCPPLHDDPTEQRVYLELMLTRGRALVFGDVGHVVGRGYGIDAIRSLYPRLAGPLSVTSGLPCKPSRGHAITVSVPRWRQPTGGAPSFPLPQAVAPPATF